MKRNYLVLFVLLIVFVIACYYLFSKGSKSYSYIGSVIPLKQVIDIDGIHSILETYSYKNSDEGDPSKKVIYVMETDKENRNISVKHYSVSVDECISIELDEMRLAIISLPANETIPYTWYYTVQSSNGLAVKESAKKLLKVQNAKNLEPGISMARENFYFETLNKGEYLFNFYYKRTDNDSYHPDEFYCKLKIKVR